MRSASQVTPESCSVLTAWGSEVLLPFGLWTLLTFPRNTVFLGRVDKIRFHTQHEFCLCLHPASNAKRPQLHQGEEKHHVPLAPRNEASQKSSQAWLPGSLMRLLCSLYLGFLFRIWTHCPFWGKSK